MTRLVPIVIALTACGDNRAGTGDASAPDAARPPCEPVRGSTVSLRRIVKLDGIAVLATAPPRDQHRLFVVLREGTIRVLVDDQLLPEPFIDLSNVIYTNLTVERGLLGMAFHPRFASNRLFYVFYTTQPSGVVARCHVSPDDPNRASPVCTPILEAVHDLAGNHNAGMIEFGPDGMLYIGTGDGGGAGDPDKRSQDPNDLLGKILRINVDAWSPGLEYGIPSNNPFAGGGGRGEVFMRGLRNPWRFSFDAANGDLWIGDVGQARFEEMNVLHPAEQLGANLGWSIYEGPGCCDTQSDHCLERPGTTLPCDPTGMVFPKDARDRYAASTNWASVIGGWTYRGTCYPDIVGYHFYSDILAGVLVKARLRPDDTLEVTDIPGVVGSESTGPSSLHADGRGEIYVTDVSGVISHLEAGP
jgi:glucose/arabinose dehydrogenase